MAGGTLRHWKAKAPKTAAAKADKALAVAKSVKKELRKTEEVKYFDNSTSFDASAVSNSGTVARLCDIAEGTDQGQRIGNKITPKYLYLRGYAQGNSTEEFNLIRLLVFIDTEQTGTDPTVADVLQITADNQVINSPVNVDHTSRYKILYDKVLNMQKSGTFVVPFKRFIKKRLRNMFFTGTTTGTQYKNQIYALVVSDVSLNDPSFSLYSRLAYVDA